MSKKSLGPTRLVLLAAVIIVVVIASMLLNKSGERSPLGSGLEFLEHKKKGGATLFILGDYFHEVFSKELGSILADLYPDCMNYFICTENIKSGLESWLEKEGISSAKFHLTERSASIMRVWARDVVVVGDDQAEKTIVVAPNMHTAYEHEVDDFYEIFQTLFPEKMKILLAPFAFAGGNLVFIHKGGKTILLVGKKILFDNASYQRNSWAQGWNRFEIVEEIQHLFNADTVVVVGRATQPPPSEIYFEGHLDMGLAVLRESKAVVGEFSFGEKEKAELREAIQNKDPVIESLFESSRDRGEIYNSLRDRLTFVSEEFDYYAILLENLGLEVLRSPMEWKHVASWMSWTNILQMGPRIFMPVYPESLGTAATLVRDERGLVKKRIQLKPILAENFSLDGYNLANYQLFKDLGYQVIPIPEHLHYFEGGLHRFVNVLY